MDYLDNVLIKLKRKYSENEVIASLTKKLSEAEIENGILKSQISELEYTLDNVKKDLRIKIKKEVYFELQKKLGDKIIKRDKLISSLRENIRQLIQVKPTPKD